MALGAAGMSYVLKQTFRGLDRGIVEAKVAHFAEQKDSFDTIFIGSSRVYHHVIPALFDRAMAERGTPTRSFNFGADGLFPPEDSYVLEQVLALKPAHLRWVFIEVSMFRPPVQIGNSTARRVSYWHDVRRTAWMCDDILERVGKLKFKKLKKQGPELAGAASQIAGQLRLCLQNLSSAGAGGESIRALLRAPDPEKTSVPVEIGDGFLPLSGLMAEDPAVLQQFRSDRVRQDRGESRRTIHSRAGRENLAHLAQLVRASGATPVFFSTPVLSPIIYTPEPKITAEFLDFTDTTKWPQLFQEEHRVDPAHLNEEGATLFTNVLVDVADRRTFSRSSE